MKMDRGLNVAAIMGRLSRPAVARELPSGDRLVALEVSIEGRDRVETVPVVWPGAPGSAESFDTDQAVLVVGRVCRRYFRSAGKTQSRTELVADLVVPTSRSKKVGSALARAAALIDGASQAR